MKLPFTLAAMFSLALLVGCNQSSDNAGASAGTEDLRASQDSQTSAEQAATETQRSPNNTGINERDRSESALTPGDQGGSEADREITRRIRQAVTQDQFSTDAKNIKIITINGKTTLRGPVKDSQERQAIETAIKGISGVLSVDNQLEPKTTNQ